MEVRIVLAPGTGEGSIGEVQGVHGARGSHSLRSNKQGREGDSWQRRSYVQRQGVGDGGV